MGWGFSLAILCMAVVLAPGSHAYSAGQFYHAQYGTVIGIVSPRTVIVFASLFDIVESKAMETDLHVCVF